MPSIREAMCLALFSALLGLSLVLGYHVVSEDGDFYAGLMSSNYLSAYSWMDLGAFFCAVIFLFATLSALFQEIKRRCRSGLVNWSPEKLEFPKVPIRYVFAATAILFLLWLPYLLLYWPGFIFGDSLDSLRQALGVEAPSNHHPYVYTLFVQGCLSIAQAMGLGNTAGCVLYCIAQMCFMGFCLGYMVIWVSRRCSVGGGWTIVLLSLFGLTPYVATYSIAMWKDPIFSASVVALAPLLMDFALSRGRVVRERKTWLPSFLFLVLVMTFARNNGAYIVVAMLGVFLAVALFFRKRHRSWDSSGLGGVSAVLLGVLALHLVVTGPVYDAVGVEPSPKVEGYGIPLNQMARVAALDGDMTDSDREYLDALLPLELYETTYRPCCTDMLKWDEEFNEEPLEEGFFSHWASMLIRNPVLYFESWELQTFGFWAVNVPEVNSYASNISGGVPRNFYSQDQLTSLGINFDNKLGSDLFYRIFPWDEWSIPVSWVFWALLYIALCLILLGRSSWLLALLPSFGLMATLVVASPLWYWPRYGAAVQFLIPFPRVANRAGRGNLPAPA